MTTVEQPDAIGWRYTWRSTLVECKASRADFLRDKRKPHRKLAGMGMRRFYFAPPGLIRVDELPDGWGLAECGPRTVAVLREAPERLDNDLRGEITLLLSLARKVGGDGPVEWLHPDALPDAGI
jgi:hypothetical protein